MAKPTVILLQLPSRSEVFLRETGYITLEGGINALAFEGGGYKVLVPEPEVEEWEDSCRVIL